MKRYLVGFLLIITFILKGYPQQFTEILGRPENNSITINVLFSQQVQVYFEYGTIKGNYQGSTQSITTATGEPAEIQITGLKPDTRYFYRTRYKLPAETIYKSGVEHSFVTQRIPGRTFRFTVESDPHPYDKKCYAPLWNIALQNQAKDSADFMIDMGDTFGDDHNPFTITNKEVQELHLNNRNFFGQVCHSLPFFFCQGNHEGESGYYLLQTPPDNLATWETLWRKLYWPNPFPDAFYTGNSTEESNGIGKPENYYAWEWGDALFIVLDMYRYYTANEKPQKWDWTIGKQQYDWLKKTLENSKSKYRLVFSHHILGQGRGGTELATLYEWGGYDQKGTWQFSEYRPGWAMPIHQLMKQNGVNIYFQGHDHLFVRQELDGIVYQTLPMPSDSSYKIGVTDNGDAYLTGKQLGGSGYLRIIVSPDSMKVDYVGAVLPKDESVKLKNGNIIYTYSVKKSIPSNTEINEVEPEKHKLTTFPNPVDKSLTILIPEGKINGFLILNDLFGRTVLNRYINNSSSKIIVDTSLMPNGIYFLRWISDGREITGKVLINHSP
jgi:hypothetical protein